MEGFAQREMPDAGYGRDLLWRGTEANHTTDRPYPKTTVPPDPKATQPQGHGRRGDCGNFRPFLPPVYKKLIKFAFFGAGTYIYNMKIRVYIDTSIVGGFFDEEFEAETQSLFKQLEDGKITFVVSDLLLRELKSAPENVCALLERYPAECFEAVVTTQDAVELANAYIAEKVIGQTSFDDCLHIAIATLNKVDILASWNFKHIVNISRIRGYNSVNMKMGYATLEIRNPKDLVEYEND